MTSLVLVNEAPRGTNYHVRVTPVETGDTCWVEVFNNDVLLEAYDTGDKEYVPKHVTMTGVLGNMLANYTLTTNEMLHSLPSLVKPRDRRPYYRLHNKSRY